MHKSRKLLTAAAVSLALSSTASYALTLGDIEMRSALNQTMDAQIRLKPATPSELTGLRVQLASQDAFSRAGLNRSAALNDLKFQVDESLPGAPVIRVTSTRPVDQSTSSRKFKKGSTTGRELVTRMTGEPGIDSSTWNLRSFRAALRCRPALEKASCDAS